MSDEELNSYAAIIVPAGYVSDRLRYTNDIHVLLPACVFLKRAFENKHILKGVISHCLWLLAPIPEVVAGRKVVVQNNLLGDVKNIGAIYVDEDVVMFFFMAPINIILDLYFMVTKDMGMYGLALATVISTLAAAT